MPDSSARAWRFAPAFLRGGRLVVPFVAAACEGPQSALQPAGRDAERIASLFWVMTAGAVVVWVGVMALAVYALRSRQHDPKKTRTFIVGGGALLPFVVLSGLLIHGLRLMPNLLEPGADDGVRIRVSAEQWWWRVRYEMPDGSQFELANELRLPLGRRVPLSVVSPDVIHSFWVPSIAGKVDAIPGRINRLALEPTRTGVFRGACAEYCGSSHARMMFHVAVMPESDFQAWVKAQETNADVPVGAPAKRGALIFKTHGCGACHAIRGTKATGVVGPDLTHVGSRLGLGAGVLDNDVRGFERWLAETNDLKPGVHMPEFDMLTGDDRYALAVYLDGLK